MSDFNGMEDLLGDFLQEASDMLSDVDNKLVDLEKNPSDHALLNDIFRGFHTIKGGAGFLSAHELVNLCHLTENLFDKLRNSEIKLTQELMDVIMAATRNVRHMFDELGQQCMPKPAEHFVIIGLKNALNTEEKIHQALVEKENKEAKETKEKKHDWEDYYNAIKGSGKESINHAVESESAILTKDQNLVDVINKAVSEKSRQNTPIKNTVVAKETTIRVDTARLDQVLNLSGEIGLIKNRLNSLKADIIAGKNDNETMQSLDQAVSQLDLLVSDLQNSVMKTRMQPIGRLFQKYPRIARDLARQLGKDIELELSGEDTEIDKTMIEDLADPLIHLVRNAVDHGVEMPEERKAAGKPEKSIVRLEAKQEGDHIIIMISDDGKGMRADKIKEKAIEKKLITEEEASILDERQSLNLIFLPGFSTKTEISDVSGRGVGMDVVKTNIQKLNGTIEIRSEAGKGSVFVISLPLTLAILPVLLVLFNNQPFAIPLSLVREIIPINKEDLQTINNKETMVIRGEILPVMPLAKMIGWEMQEYPKNGVVVQVAEKTFILGVDSFAGRDDAVIKSLEDFRPKGIAGVTTLATGQIVLIVDMKELLVDSYNFK